MPVRTGEGRLLAKRYDDPKGILKFLLHNTKYSFLLGHVKVGTATCCWLAEIGSFVSKCNYSERQRSAHLVWFGSSP